ncbi:ENTH domain [Carpediemonas membranifera]|uniref:ENTH domain n=1 Tax=Carpediemonas membranifera TaxID=201153 RepID=A0A8J6BUV6_9EUKA|nr:ENTH domain [Carpediemonas membranifera]|eukprot:KAG9390756.1 ENTH domain [Carpediemonas membranifera]
MVLNGLTAFVGKEIDRAHIPVLTQAARRSTKKSFNVVKDTIQHTTDMQKLVREASSNEAWPAPPELLRQIAQTTFNYRTNQMLFPAIWERMSTQPGKRWRVVYKCLNLLEYVLLNGSTDAVDMIKSNIYQLNTLSDYQYHDERGEDQGFNVRTKVEKLLALVNSDRLPQQREDILQRRKRFVGIGAGSSVVNRIRSTSNASAFSPSTTEKPTQQEILNSPPAAQPKTPEPTEQVNEEQDLMDLFGVATSPGPTQTKAHNDDAFSFIQSTASPQAASVASSKAVPADPFAEIFSSHSTNTSNPIPTNVGLDLFSPPASAQPVRPKQATMDDLFSF